MRVGRVALATAMLGGALGCVGAARSKGDEADVKVQLVDCVPQPPMPERPSQLTPLEAAGEFEDLTVPGFGAAVVSVPVGATGPRPVIVAAHGAGDRPDWQCRYWRTVAGGGVFVLCPRGHAMDPRAPEESGYFFTTHLALGDEISAALLALEERFEKYVDTEDPVFAGFSQGAIMGALLLPNHGARFARAVLVEGGYGGFQEWNVRVARQYKDRGGQRLLIACGRSECAAEADVSAGYLRRQGLDVRVVHAPGAGHTYGGGVGDEVARAFAWVVERDRRFVVPAR